MILEQLLADQPLPIQLLMEADPDEAKVRDYCQAGQVWVLRKDRVLGVAVLLPVTNSPLPVAEIKNIAIQPDLQGRGLGKRLLHFLIAEARRQGFSRLQVATGNSSIYQLAFYQKAGFEMLRIDRHYFTRNYPEPIIENCIPCRHRVWLELELNQKPSNSIP